MVSFSSMALAGAIFSAANAHTWIEQMLVIAANGTLTGEPGFARGNVLRSSPGFSDPTMVNLIPADGRPINQIFDTDPICKSTQQQQTQTDGSPRLKAPAGANVALRYQENGHVTLPQNQPGKPSNRGTVFLYGTTQPKSDDTLLGIHRVWNADGSGGDKRGVLLSTQNFDDGECYQINNGDISVQRQAKFPHTADQLQGANLWCQHDIQLPTTAPSGQPYTLYWVWDWPTLPGGDFPEGKQEIYTTCMDVDITDDASDVNAQSKVTANSFVKQPVGNAGIASQLADIANPTAVQGQFIPFSGQASGTSPAGASNSGAPAATETATPAAVSNAQSSPSGAASPSSDAQPTPSGNNDSSQNGRPTGRPDGRPHGSFPPGVSPAVMSAISSAFAGSGNTGGVGPATVTVMNTVAVTQTAFVTVTAGAQKRDATTTSSFESSSSTKAACSKSEAAYRLRARSPFYILPPIDDPSTGC